MNCLFFRIYRFDRKDDLNDFKVELLKRPLVLQPIVHLGRGLGSGSMACGMCYKDGKSCYYITHLFYSNLVYFGNS